MAAMLKKWYRSRRNQCIIVVITLICVIYYICVDHIPREANLDITRSSVDQHPNSAAVFSPLVASQFAQHLLNVSIRTTTKRVDLRKRNSIIEYIESKLEEALKTDKGTGCEIPQLDPFAKEVMKFTKKMPKVVCEGDDWVKCYLHECRVQSKILDTAKSVKCTYKDILYESDYKYTIGPPTTILDGDAYVLTKSDHVVIQCTMESSNDGTKKWWGVGVGFRTEVEGDSGGDWSEPGGEWGESGGVDVAVLGFDSTSRLGFRRSMPKAHAFITEQLNMTILEGYNILGDGTPAALFPILTGKNELELPDARKTSGKITMDSFPFIFKKLKQNGYRTAYFEDSPSIGTFQYRFNGFLKQPADHYLRAFYLEQEKLYSHKSYKYCVGDTPRYKLMMNITDQFLKLPGKHFIFTFIADITHDDSNMISTADDDLVEFLTRLKNDGTLERTMLIIMGDHGPRYANVRNTLQGKLEERLPLMGIHLPPALTRHRAPLRRNTRALTTAHDLHHTLLRVTGLMEYRSLYRVKGAELYRGLDLFEEIPTNRSCSEAGIEAHWCACLKWEQLTQSDKLYQKAAEAFVDYINEYTESVRSKCVPRTLTSIYWVMRQKANKRLLDFQGAKDADGYVGKFGSSTKQTNENYQIKVSVGPGNGIYEASATYNIAEDKFTYNIRSISRVNAYNEEPSCISVSHPHLNMYCYCKMFVTN